TKRNRIPGSASFFGAAPAACLLGRAVEIFRQVAQNHFVQRLLADYAVAEDRGGGLGRRGREARGGARRSGRGGVGCGGVGCGGVGATLSKRWGALGEQGIGLSVHRQRLGRQALE